MARAWRGPDGDGLLDLELVLATALHDAPWREADRRPRLYPATGAPFDFVTYPREEKYAFLARGLDELEAIHSRVGILVSLHHESFLGENALPGWREREAARRARLSRRAGDHAEGAEADLALLQLFDNLSLFLCLSPPGSDPDSVPGWLTGDGLYAVPGGGPILERQWVGPDTLALRPFPFGGEVELEIPYRDLSPGPFGSQEELDGAWESASDGVWRPRLVESA